MVVTIPEKPLELHLRRKILIAYDNSEYSKHVYKYALDNILIPNHDHVALVTVVDEEQTAYIMTHFKHASRAQKNENRLTNRRLSFTEHQELSDILKPLSEELAAKGITSNFYILKGDAKVQLVKLIELIHANLCIVGTRGLGLLKRNLIGSVSEYVIRHAECPVLVIKESERKAGSRPTTPTSSTSKGLQSPIALFRTLTK